MKVTSIPPLPPEPNPPPTIQARGYFTGPPTLQDSTQEGRVVAALRAVAALRDGNQILMLVADLSAFAISPTPLPPPPPAPPPPYSQELLTAMTQLAVTGSAAFAAWAKSPTRDLTTHLVEKGLSTADAATVNKQIFSDLNAAVQAVRNPRAGMTEDALRAGMASSWIAVSAEDDAPDFPVNVFIAPYPQFHLPITVDGHDLSIRYIMASSQLQSAMATEPVIPPDDEIVLFIHGEGSRAEEACDLIPQLFSVGQASGRSFTVVALDLPGSAYSTMISHSEVAPGPFITDILGVEISGFGDTPLLDFIERTIVTFVETLLVPLGNPITAVVGGSLGGHMALRLAASQKDWVNAVVAWSPASVEDYTTNICFVDLPNHVLADPHLAKLALADEVTGGRDDSRHDFFSAVWEEATFPPRGWALTVFEVAAGLVVANYFISTGPFGWLVMLCIVGSLLGLPSVLPQPQMWYRDDWGAPAPGSTIGQAKVNYIWESRLDRREIYGEVSRQWHWRICMEILGFNFDASAQRITKPLLLMVGEIDDYNGAHFCTNVKSLAGTLVGPGHALTVQDTGHSIHAERPCFLATQIVNFAPVAGLQDLWLFAAVTPSV
jgi:pimeloyl-ACP methyl ester carboxylesterase